MSLIPGDLPSFNMCTASHTSSWSAGALQHWPLEFVALSTLFMSVISSQLYRSWQYPVQMQIKSVSSVSREPSLSSIRSFQLIKCNKGHFFVALSSIWCYHITLLSYSHWPLILLLVFHVIFIAQFCYTKFTFLVVLRSLLLSLGFEMSPVTHGLFFFSMPTSFIAVSWRPCLMMLVIVLFYSQPGWALQICHPHLPQIL